MSSRRPSLALIATGLALLTAGASSASAATDPLLADQWPLADAVLGARTAWEQSRGEGVVVAVLDSGVQLDHPDLAANLWTNPREIAGNGRDDDADGFVDDVHGANMLDGRGAVADDVGHGTHVAGIIAARAGNGIGGAGLAPRARIMAVKVLDAEHACSTTSMTRGIRYAVDAGARILNISLSGDGTSRALEDALAYAAARGATVVASAGNDARDLDARPAYPASSANPAVVSVSASGRRGSLLASANRGLRSVDLAAPGRDILSTAWGSDYESRSGTSMATPHVSGALALMAAARPDLGQPALRQALLATAPRAPALLGLLGSGELDVGAALHAILPGALWRTTDAATPRVRLHAASTIRAGRTATLRWSARGARSVSRWSVQLDGRSVTTREAGGPQVLRKRLTRPGRHRWRVVAIDTAGNPVASASRAVRVVRAR